MKKWRKKLATYNTCIELHCWAFCSKQKSRCVCVLNFSSRLHKEQSYNTISASRLLQVCIQNNNALRSGKKILKSLLFLLFGCFFFSLLCSVLRTQKNIQYLLSSSQEIIFVFITWIFKRCFPKYLRQQWKWFWLFYSTTKKIVFDFWRTFFHVNLFSLMFTLHLIRVSENLQISMGYHCFCLAMRSFYWFFLLINKFEEFWYTTSPGWEMLFRFVVIGLF